MIRAETKTRRSAARRRPDKKTRQRKAYVEDGFAGRAAAEVVAVKNKKENTHVKSVSVVDDFSGVAKPTGGRGRESGTGRPIAGKLLRLPDPADEASMGTRLRVPSGSDAPHHTLITKQSLRDD